MYYVLSIYLYISFYIDRTQYIITTIIVYILCITFYINLQLHISFYYYVLRSLLNDICNHRYHILYSRIVVISPTHQLCPLTLLTLLTLLTNLRYSRTTPLNLLTLSTTQPTPEPLRRKTQCRRQTLLNRLPNLNYSASSRTSWRRRRRRRRIYSYY